MVLSVELTRFRVKPDKHERAHEWMEYLSSNLPAAVATLKDEKMYVETIFKEEVDGTLYLYWYSVQGSGGMDVDKSEHELDKMHVKFWEECIDRDYRPIDMCTQVVLIPDNIRQIMEQDDQNDTRIA